jgi:alkylhydroperoxidase family enzyme
MRYAERLTNEPAALGEAHIEALRAAGLDDGQILEANQVIAYFAYANRTVLGLGVTTGGEVLGLSPANAGDPDDWRHR